MVYRGRSRIPGILPIGQEPVDARFGQWMLNHLQQDLVRNSCDMSAGPGRQGTVKSMADAGGEHLGLDLLGVKYIVSARDITDLDSSVDATSFPVVFEADGITVRENPGVLPRILAATTIYIDADFDRAITQGTMADVDYRSTVVLEHLPSTLAGADTSEGTSTLPAGEGVLRASLLAYGNNEVTVAVETERDAIIVLNDLYYPYWQVYVDGEERELLQANYLFRAVHVRPGDRRVVFRFEPFSRSAIKATLLRYLERE